MVKPLFVSSLVLTLVLAGCTKGAGTANQAGNASQPVKSPAQRGREVAQNKGCFACHSEDGSRKIGPTWKGIYGSEEELTDGSKVKVEDGYLRESMMDPMVKVVKGYPPSMPPYKGQLAEEEISSLIEYIKSLK